MKHPFWLANSILLCSLILTLLFVFFSRQKKPRRIPFEPEVEVKPIKKEISKIDPSKIYTNDLFGTYKEPIALPVEVSEIKPVPQPPTPTQVRPQIAPPPRFLEPLPITLKGIILTGEEKDNRVIIEDNKTKKATNYKLGEKIEDAQLIRILKNKVMFIRSNGQQETLYVNQFDAKADQLLRSNDWSTVIKQRTAYHYQIDPYEFSLRVRSLAQCIDLLNITTVYQKGKSIGLRIGKIDQQSFGSVLGLQQGDIITSINNIAPITTEQRYEIYKQLANAPLGTTITLKLKRHGAEIEISYTIDELEKTLETQKELALQQRAIRPSKLVDTEQEKIKLLQEKFKFAPTEQQLLKHEKNTMLQQGKKEVTSARNVLLESVQEQE